MEMKKGLVITIDGPAGVGKSTLAKGLAKKLGFIYLDTGALYRAVAVKCVKDGIDPDDDDALRKICNGLQLEVQWDGECMHILCCGENITNKLREKGVSNLASKVSAKKFVRDALLGIQRRIGKRGGVVAEGRDTGTVIFPDADIKLFLEASFEERVNRRWKELRERGIKAERNEIEKEIEERDRRDSTRNVAPLKPAKDAIILDTTYKNREGVLAEVIEIIKVRTGRSVEE